MQDHNFNGAQRRQLRPRKRLFARGSRRGCRPHRARAAPAAQRIVARAPAAPRPHGAARARSVSGSRGRRPRRTRAAPRSRGAIVHVCGESMAGRCCGCSLAAVALILARTRAPRRTACVCASTMYYTPGDRADGDGCGCGGEAGRAERRMVVISKATESDHGKN